ncbi:MAG: alpha/beta hydrolase [Zoogloeaceae bacterium]|nr:alpha/beta hydrolase [Zoogloeaceae bacterium]
MATNQIRKIIAIVLLMGFAMTGAVRDSGAAEPREVGIVLMHGKGGDTKWVDPLAEALRDEGYTVLVPDLAWHRNRIYDQTFDQAMAEIHGHVQRLRTEGKPLVVVAGHSLGAIAAAGYAARHDDAAGIVLLAPGHFTAWPGFRAKVEDDVNKAAGMIANGQGEATSRFMDINGGKRDARIISANIFHSWFAPDGPAEFVRNMMEVKGGIPILYVAGELDKIPQTKNPGYAFELAPANAKSKFVVLDDAKHLEVPRKAVATVTGWLREL